MPYSEYLCKNKLRFELLLSKFYFELPTLKSGNFTFLRFELKKGVVTRGL